MRVLAHIHTFNDADIIDRTIEAVLQQTRPVDGIVVVDNASTDATLDQPCLKHAAILRQSQNLGTSGAVFAGMRHALEQDYDWIWLFDADSTAEPDALERLLEFYNGLSEDLQGELACLACLPYNQVDASPLHAAIFTRRGRVVVRPSQDQRCYPFHATLWSGSLYRLAAVRQIGMPNLDYVLDCGEDEYGYRVMKAGYKAFMHQDAVMKHNIRGSQSLVPIKLKVGPASVKVYDFPAIRCYYLVRNGLYFMLYEFAKGRLGPLCGALWRVRPRRQLGLGRGAVWNVLLFTMNFLLRPRTHGRQIAACLLGMWHGVTGNMAARY
jgi:glycosyltransferase involved in cell wall biosynthesis